ncbi:MAG TPA: response regulator, partial [Acidimicrobiales bacterium]
MTRGSGAKPAPRRVVVVEDSGVQRANLRRVIEADGDLAVVAEAGTAAEAVLAVRQARPHVATIDLDIPGGGLEAIRSIMATRPTPLLVVSAAVGGLRAASVVEALASGAADALPKPVRWSPGAEDDVRARIRALTGIAIRSVPPTVSGCADVVVAVAASTGGPAALA